MSDGKLIRYPYIPPVHITLFQKNKAAIKSKPYAKYFNGDLYVPENILHVLNNGPLSPDDLPECTSSYLNTVVDGTDRIITAYGANYDEGRAFTASRTFFPKATGEMIQWWFWWHSVERERYTLWHPYCHIEAIAQNRAVLSEKGLSHYQRYIGNQHYVKEYIGENCEAISIEFCNPGDMGIDESVFDKNNVVAHACGHVYLLFPRLLICRMIHLWIAVPGGLELRSRYFLEIEVSFFGLSISKPFKPFGRRLITEKVSYEQMMHDQIEFTHLASFLPDLYTEFVSGTEEFNLVQEL